MRLKANNTIIKISRCATLDILSKEKGIYTYEIKKKIESVEFKHWLVSILKTHKPTHVLHLASSNLPYDKNNEYSKDILFETNIIYTSQLLEAIAIVNKDIHVFLAGSSQQIGCVTELDSLSDLEISQSPINFYGWSKKINFQQAECYRSYGLKICFGILFNHDSWARNSSYLLNRIADKVIKSKFSFQEQVTTKQKVDFDFPENAFFDLSSAHDITQDIIHIMNNQIVGNYYLASGHLTSIKEILEVFVDVACVEIFNNNLPLSEMRKLPSRIYAFPQYEKPIRHPGNRRKLDDIIKEIYLYNLKLTRDIPV